MAIPPNQNGPISADPLGIKPKPITTMMTPDNTTNKPSLCAFFLKTYGFIWLNVPSYCHRDRSPPGFWLMRLLAYLGQGKARLKATNISEV
jgi:hypothetical protein